MKGYDTFAERLKWALDEEGRVRGRNRSEVAAAMGMASGRLSEWTRATDLKLSSILPLGEALPWLSWDWLLFKRGEPYRVPSRRDISGSLQDLLVVLASDPTKEPEARETVVRMILEFLQAQPSGEETPQ